MYAIDSSVREGFSRAKQDIEALRQENHELRAIIMELKERMQEEQPTIVSEPQPIQGGDIKAAIKEALSEMGAYDRKTVAIQDDSMSRFGLDKKAVIKAKILETIQHAPVLLPRLKEIVVDQNKYCSKASFYRYMDELKKEEKADLIMVNDRTLVRPKMEVYSS